MAARKARISPVTFLDNSAIAELLAGESETAQYPLKKALRRASRRAFVWPEEAAQIIREGRSLTELRSVWPYLENVIRRWVKDPPALPEPPAIRKGFFTIPQARSLLASDPSWLKDLKGDLQMHTRWSDGLGSIREMADAAVERGYEYIAITDHSKGLKIAGGINEEQLAEQAHEIRATNHDLQSAGKRIRVLH